MFDYIDLMTKLSVANDKKIVLIVMDGLGGCELEQGGKTELAAANTPNLDELAKGGVCGLSDPIAPGFTPGSGPAHLSLFGYDPIRYEIGRGILAASGIGFELERTDVAARGNFATIGDGGEVTDRRAGRISTEKNAELCELLGGIEIDGVKIFVKPVKDHRCVAVFRGEGLGGDVADSDPQFVGKKPLKLAARSAGSEKTAEIANKFIEVVFDRLKGLQPANGMLMRGFDGFPSIPKMADVTKMNPGCIAVYPDYKGIARIIGMQVYEAGETVADEVECLKENFADHDFFYLHVKKTDSYGEDGNFDAKVHVIEELDAALPGIVGLKPDVIMVTGDHSTPALLKSHSWHPVPVLLNSDVCRRDAETRFDELACVSGGLGRVPSVSLMPLMMSNAAKLLKFGA